MHSFLYAGNIIQKFTFNFLNLQPSFIKPTLKTPLQPGNWKVKLLSLEGYLLAEVKMLVLPLEHFQGKTISRTNMHLINAKQFSTFESEGNVVVDSNNEMHQRKELQGWIDSLVEE